MEEKKTASETPPSTLQTLRTYEGDVRDTVKKDKVSLTKMAIAEQSKVRTAGEVGKQLPTNRKKNIIISISILFILAAGVLLYLVVTKRNAVTEIEIAARPQLLLAVESEKEVVLKDTTKVHLLEAIRREVNGPQTVATMRAFFLKTGENRYMTSTDFLGALEIPLPPSLTRTILPNMTIGSHAFDGNHLFLVLKIDSYDQSVAGMFDWEHTMIDTLGPLIVGRTVSSEERKSFTDGVAKNIDTRMLRSNDNKLLLMYAFLDRDTIVITDSEVTLAEISKRLRDIKLKR